MLNNRNYLHGCLLLLIAESPTHGYDLVERLPEFGLANIDSAGVYRALRTLNADRLLESWWEESETGPVRRRYRISEAGAATLEDWAATVGDSASHLNSVLARHHQLRQSTETLSDRRPA
ncbi:MAG: PadR family transcriptional regulator [Acidimicrobiales bacterium]